MIRIPISKSLKDLASRHAQSCLARLTKRDLRYLNLFFINEIEMNYEEVLVLEPEEIDAVACRIGNLKGTKLNYLKNQILIYKNFSKTNADFGLNYSVVDLVRTTGMKVCPYCNRNYITVVGGVGSKRVRTAQIDHFWDKESYPYLALAFFNLVPSCGYCNQKKSVTQVGLSPYHRDLNTDSVLTFSHNELPLPPLRNIDQINIEILPGTNKEFLSNQKKFALEELYKTHTDVAYSTYLKSFCFPESKIDELYQQLAFAFTSRDELKKYLFNIPTGSKDYVNQPLAKFIRDLAIKYGIEF